MSLRFRGRWEAPEFADAEIDVNDVVTYAGVCFVCTSAHWCDDHSHGPPEYDRRRWRMLDPRELEELWSPVSELLEPRSRKGSRGLEPRGRPSDLTQDLWRS